jgi:ABC-2 type transport system ATP-binding protein
MNELILKTEDLCKTYGGFLALDNVNVQIPKGRIVGLLGPNGSGKTTFIKILSGLLTATSGTVLIDGMEPSEKTKAIVSYLPERTYFNPWMKVNECLTFFEDFYADFDRAVAEKMLFDLNISLDSRLRTLSKGTKEKLQLILVMSRRAKLFVLDEPIAGVDPAARDYIIKTVIENYNREASIIISTHLIYDIEPVLDDFFFLNGGRIMLSGDVKEIRRTHGTLDGYFREVFRCY